MKDVDLAIALTRRIWEERDVLHHEDRRDQSHSPGVPPTTLRLTDGTSVGIKESPWRVKVDMAGHRQDLEHYCASIVIHAWRAAQSAGILAGMGDTADPETVMMTPAGRVRRIVTKLGAAPRPEPLNVQNRLDAMIAERVRAGKTGRIDAKYETATWQGEPYTAEALWNDAGDGVLFLDDKSWDLHGENRFLSVMHPTWGTLHIPSVQTRRALLAMRDKAHTGALASRKVPILAPPPSGNARIARITQVCRKALAMDPDLADRGGAPIRPLIERHLPELLRIHAEAAATAPAERLAEVDLELERGIETIRRAVEESLSMLHERRRDDLADQLRFLEARHPTGSGID